MSDQPADRTIHSVLPNMATACAENLLTVLTDGDGFTLGASNFSTITCVWCRSLGPRTLRAMTRQMQSNPAKIA